MARLKGDDKTTAHRSAEAPQPEFLTVGQVLSPYGTKGEVEVEVLTDFPERFAPNSIVYIDEVPITIEDSKGHKGKIRVKLAGVDNIAAAQRLQGKSVEIHHSQAEPLPEGEYYHFQVTGLKVRTTQGELLGEITSVLKTGSNDVYLVRGPQGEILIPAIEDVVKSVSLQDGFVIVEAIKGILKG